MSLKASSASGSDEIRVLHVDDEPDFADLAATFLTRADDRIEVQTATNTDDGLEILAEHSIDCIVSDYEMPGRNGLKFLEAVRKEHPKLPFILFTGRGSEEVASEAISAGVSDYLQKGSGTGQYTVLANRIRNYVEQAQTQHEHEATRRRMELALEKTDSLIFEIDLDTGSVTRHGRFERLFDLPADKVPTWEDYLERTVHPEDQTDFRHFYRQVLDGERDSGALEYRTTSESEDIRWIRDTVHVDEVNPRHVLGIAQEITTQKEQAKERKQIVERVTDAIVEVDADWTFTFLNDQAKELYGMDESSLLGQGFWEVFPEARDTPFEEEYRHVMETRESTSFVEYFSQLDGWFDIEAYPKSDGGIVFYFVDVTDQREHQNELERANALLSTLFETLPVGVLAEDTDRNVLAVNERMFEILEFPGTSDEIIGTNCEQLAEYISETLVDSEGFIEQVNELVADGEPAKKEELTLRDGRTFERKYRPIKLPDGDGHLWVSQDITEQKEQTERLRVLSERSQDLMTADTREQIAEIGIKAASDILGLDANAIYLCDEERSSLVPVATTDAVRDLIGDPPVFTGGDSIAWRVYERGEAIALADIRNEPEVYNPETLVRSELYLPLGVHGLLMAGSPTSDSFGHQDLALGKTLAGNIASALEQVAQTEQLHARKEQLTRQNERLEEFSSIVSHDLRNPLNVAEGNLELVREDYESEPLDAIEQAHDRMETLIDDLLEVARKGEIVADTEPVDLTMVINECWRNVATANASLNTDIDRIVDANRNRLKQVFENLF